MTFTWTDDAVAELRKCVADGMSAGQTAAHIGGHFEGDPSRNAIIGKATRLKLGWRNRPNVESKSKAERQQQRRQPRAKSAPMRWGKQASAVPLPPTRALTLDPGEIPQAQRKTLLELTNETCRWPYGEPGQPDFFFCGAPEADCAGGRSYCAAHGAMSHSRREAA